MPVTLLATSLERKGLPAITSATELGQYLAHGEYIPYLASGAAYPQRNTSPNIIVFAQDSCTFRASCTFVPPLNVLVTLKPSLNHELDQITLQFNRVEYIATSSYDYLGLFPREIKMYVDQSVDGLTPPAERIKGNNTPGYTAVANFTWHQYLKMSGAFDSDRPFWKDRNTKMTEFLESQRERKHICTLTNEERANFTWNANLNTTFNPSQHSADRLPDEANGWTVFRNWKLLDGEDLIVVGENGIQELEIQEPGIYELHFNVFFYASMFSYDSSEFSGTFANRADLDVAISEYLSSDPIISSNAYTQYGAIQNWEFASAITSFDNLFENYTTLSNDALTLITANWTVSNILSFTDMFKGTGTWPINIVLAINSAWGTAAPNIWSQTAAQLKTAPFETRGQLITAISGYPASSAVYGPINTWLFDSGLTSFEGIFSNQDIDTWDISTWDVQYVTNMKSMFEGANGLNQHDITGWDVSNVTDMSSMFKDCVNFDQNISSWDVSIVTDMSSMFEDCTDISDGLRNNIHNWQNISPGISTVENVVNFANMFLNSGNWPVDTVVAINAAWGTANQTYWSQTTAQLLIAPFETRDQVIDAIDLWYTSPTTYEDTYGNMSSWEFASTLTNFSGLFNRDSGLPFAFDEDISGWDVSNVTNMSSMFKGCASFNQDISDWNVEYVTDMSSMFEGCSSFNQHINYQLAGALSSAWDVSNVTDMSSMFKDCSSFDGNITDWVVSGVRDMSSMFKGCSSFNRDINTNGNAWNVGQVQDMSSMFEGCSNYDRNIPDWDVSSVTDMSFMFKNCSTNIMTPVTHPDLSSWNVSNVEDMTSMFENCDPNLGSTNMNALVQWDVSSVGVTAVDNTELWSVDYVFQTTNQYLPSGVEDPVSGDDDGSSWIGPNGQSDLIYKTFTGQDGPWNKIVLNNAGSAYTTATVTDKYTLDEVESCLQDGSGIYKAKSNVTHVANTQELPHQTYSPRQSNFDKGFAGFDVLSTISTYASPNISFEFRNLPPGTYDLRLYGQPHTGITGITEIYNHATFSVTGAIGTINDQVTSSTNGYVTFTNLSLAASTLGFVMEEKAGSGLRVFSVGGVQLKRTYQVSKFKDMFKGSSWTETSYGTVVDNIDSQWKSNNANWWKNEAKLSESS